MFGVIFQTRSKSFAEEHAGELVVVEVTYVIPDGQSFILPVGASTPDNHPGYEQWATKKKARLGSGQTLGDWLVDLSNVNIQIIEGFGVVWGPATLRFYREIK